MLRRQGSRRRYYTKQHVPLNNVFSKTVAASKVEGILLSSKRLCSREMQRVEGDFVVVVSHILGGKGGLVRGGGGRVLLWQHDRGGARQQVATPWRPIGMAPAAAPISSSPSSARAAAAAAAGSTSRPRRTSSTAAWPTGRPAKPAAPPAAPAWCGGGGRGTGAGEPSPSGAVEGPAVCCVVADVLARLWVLVGVPEPGHSFSFSLGSASSMERFLRRGGGPEIATSA